MPTHPPFKPPSIALPVVMLMVAMVSFQAGAAIVKQMFPVVGAAGATALRLGLGGVIMAVVWRPWRLRLSARKVRVILVYGLAMGFMNFFFYLSLSRIPLGIAVAVEFAGPLAVAMAASRRAIDFLWIALAAAGLLALLPMGHDAKPLDLLGILYGMGAAVFWALYIVFGQKAGTENVGQTAAMGTVIAALVLVPIGVAHTGWTIFSPAVLPVGFAVAILSSALPYTLEMYAMNRVPARTFGVLMSLDPALAALSGLVFLSESLSVIQWGAIASIMLASAGSAATGRPRPQLLPD